MDQTSYENLLKSRAPSAETYSPNREISELTASADPAGAEQCLELWNWCGVKRLELLAMVRNARHTAEWVEDDIRKKKKSFAQYLAYAKNTSIDRLQIEEAVASFSQEMNGYVRDLGLRLATLAIVYNQHYEVLKEACEKKCRLDEGLSSFFNISPKAHAFQATLLEDFIGYYGDAMGAEQSAINDMRYWRKQAQNFAADPEAVLQPKAKAAPIKGPAS